MTTNSEPTGGYINKLRKDWEAILQKDAEMVRRAEPTGELLARAEAVLVNHIISDKARNN